MTTTDEAAAPGVRLTETTQVAWHTLERAEATDRLRVSPATGLSGAEAASRMASVGPNRFATAAVEPRWRAFVRQYRDPMQIGLLVAGGGGPFSPKEVGPGPLVLFLA